MSKEAEIAWAAGLFDGEGCVRIQLWNFRVSARKALVVLEVLLPHLVTKKEQAELAIRFCEIESNRGHGRLSLDDKTVAQRHQYMEQINKLKR